MHLHFLIIVHLELLIFYVLLTKVCVVRKLIIIVDYRNLLVYAVCLHLLLVLTHTISVPVTSKCF